MTGVRAAVPALVPRCMPKSTNTFINFGHLCQRRRQAAYSLLVPLAQDLVAAPASQVYVERVFSVQRRRIEALEARAPPPDSMATLVNSLQNQVNAITLCVTLNANTGKVVLVTLCIQIEWLFYNAFWCETVPRK